MQAAFSLSLLVLGPWLGSTLFVLLRPALLKLVGGVRLIGWWGNVLACKQRCVPIHRDDLAPLLTRGFDRFSLEKTGPCLEHGVGPFASAVRGLKEQTPEQSHNRLAWVAVH